MADDKPVGKVVHYYDKIGVAVVKLEKGVKVGDTVKFERGEESLSQSIESMQFDHAPIIQGKKGQEVAIKVEKPVRQGTLLYSA
jgi:hypothetical protein